MLVHGDQKKLRVRMFLLLRYTEIQREGNGQMAKEVNARITLVILKVPERKIGSSLTCVFAKAR